ncbi:hypothetical protein CLIB1444_01S15522 [[Candida] jaroonii]|uniref:Uncharacterized protein n=1 Tax=[Candida] jaroonii TaxID=467808 RepID=A0ACA9Y1K4_9ASCO|nr:hypothetical protein CLIB1444_01S15522 [[Candida] jaroonii]
METSFNIQYDCINLSLLDYNLLISPCKTFLSDSKSLPNELYLIDIDNETHNEIQEEIFTIDEVKIAGYQSEDSSYIEF